MDPKFNEQNMESPPPVIQSRNNNIYDCTEMINKEKFISPTRDRLQYHHRYLSGGGSVNLQKGKPANWQASQASLIGQPLNDQLNAPHWSIRHVKDQGALALENMEAAHMEAAQFDAGMVVPQNTNF